MRSAVRRPGSERGTRGRPRARGAHRAAPLRQGARAPVSRGPGCRRRVARPRWLAGRTPERTVVSVAMTPTRPDRVAAAAAAAPGRTMLRIGTGLRRRSCAKATEDEVLHATTIALTPCPTRWSRHSPLSGHDLRVGTRAVRGARVVAEVDGALAREPATDLAQHGESTDAGVEQPDGPRVAHGDLTARGSSYRSRRCASPGRGHSDRGHRARGQGAPRCASRPC